MSYRKAVSRVLAAVLIVVVLLAAAGGVYLYYGKLPIPGTFISTAQFTSSAQGPAQFTFWLEPPFCRAAPGGGAPIRVFVDRSPSFSGAVRVDLVNHPSWVIPKPLTLDATATNATLLIGVAKDAPKTKVTLTVRASAQGSADQTASLDMKVVAVSTVTSKYGAALVYETTKILDSETLQALTSYSMDKVVFSKMTAQLKSLERGDVMSAPPPASPLVPGGFFLTVLSVHEEGGSVVVETRRASLLEAVQEIEVGRPPGGSGLTAAGGAGMGPSFAPAYAVVRRTLWGGTIGFDWTNVAEDREWGGRVEAKAVVKATVDLVIGIGAGWSGVDWAFIHVGAGQEAAIALSGKAGSELKWVDDDLGEIIPEQEIFIIPGIFWIEVGMTWEARASGRLDDTVDFKFSEQFGVEVGPTYDEDHDPELYLDCYWTPGAEPCSSGPDLTKSVQSTVGLPGSGGGSHARIGIGPRLQASFNAGLYEIAKGYIGGFISANLFFEYDSNPTRPRWWVDGGIDAWWGIFWGFSVLWGLGDWGDEWSNSLGDILRVRLITAPSENTPPVVAITNYEAESTIALGALLLLPPFEATATDLDDGSICSMGVWTVDGVQVGTGCTLPFPFSNEGDYQITFAATDSEGVTASATVLVHVKPKPPNYPPTILSLQPNLRTPQDVNTPIMWTCLASDPDKNPPDPIQYQFWLWSGDGPWVITQKWSGQNYWIWTPTTAGTYKAGVWVRDGNHQGADWFDDSKEMPYTINKPPIVQPTQFDFEVSVSPTTNTVFQGETATYTITVTSKTLIGGQTQPVRIDVLGEGWPPHSCCIWTVPVSGTPTFTSTLAIHVTKDTPAGTYILTIVATGGGLTRYAYPTLQVNPQVK